MWRVAAAPATAAPQGKNYLQKKAETAHCGRRRCWTTRGRLARRLSILQNRGYDSAGMATLKRGTNELAVTKYASKGARRTMPIRAHAEKHAGHHVGIAHAGDARRQDRRERPPAF